jgi:hypothetical protein
MIALYSSANTTLRAVLSLSGSVSETSGRHSQRSSGDNERIQGVRDAAPYNTEASNISHSFGPSSGRLIASQAVWNSGEGCEEWSSEDGSSSKPVRLLVCILNGCSEPLLVPSFMHLQMSVILQFAAGVGQVRQALLENDKVWLYSCIAWTRIES